MATTPPHEFKALLGQCNSFSGNLLASAEQLPPGSVNMTLDRASSQGSQKVIRPSLDDMEHLACLLTPILSILDFIVE